MVRYKIILAYDGTDLFGSQRQASACTAQSELEKALRRLGWLGKSVLLAGRTDSGVHASGQVATFDILWKHNSIALVKALNSNLPSTMSVKHAEIVRDNFHPRFDALSRKYCYRLYCQEVRDPLRERFAWRLWPVPDETFLDQAASLIIGEHDFGAFGTPPRPGNSTIRTVMTAIWCSNGDEWTFEVQADAFLYHMVRRLVFVQVAVGQGKFPLQIVSDLLEKKTNQLPAGLAPANGLTLVEVKYPE